MTTASLDPYLLAGAGVAGVDFSSTAPPCNQDLEGSVALSIETLKNERDGLKAQLREVEAEQRRIEAELKRVRQRELQTKREIEALTTLIEIAEGRENRDD